MLSVVYLSHQMQWIIPQFKIVSFDFVRSISPRSILFIAQRDDIIVRDDNTLGALGPPPSNPRNIL